MFKNAQILWRDAMGQTNKDWLPKASPSLPTGPRFPSMDPISIQRCASGGNRLTGFACDDLRYAMTNPACSGIAPIELSSLGFLAKMFLSVGPSQRLALL